MRAGVGAAGVARLVPRASSGETASTSAPRAPRRTDRAVYVARCRSRRGRFLTDVVRPDPVVDVGTDTTAETTDAWPRALRLAVAARARATRSDPEQVWTQVRVLEKIVPGLATDSLLAKGPNASSVIRLAADADASAVASCVLALRRAFPTANVARIAGRAPGVLAMSPGDLTEATRVVKEALKTLGDGSEVDRAVEANQALLDAERLTEALATLRRAMPGVDGAKLIRKNPSMLFVDSDVKEGYQE